MDNELLHFARFAAAVARRVAPGPSRFATPAYAPAALFALLLLRERLRLTHRGPEDLLLLSAASVTRSASEPSRTMRRFGGSPVSMSILTY